MNIYCLQAENFDYDDYESFVVRAESESSAREIATDYAPRQAYHFHWHATCELIGTAPDGSKPGIVLASMH